jgi:autoinducer 2-degrading protein
MTTERLSAADRLAGGGPEAAAIAPSRGKGRRRMEPDCAIDYDGARATGPCCRPTGAPGSPQAKVGPGEEAQMLKSYWTSAATIALVAGAAILLAPPSQRVAAQSAGTIVNAIDLEIAPAEMDKFLVAIKENGAATVKEPGCQRFDIMVLAGKPNQVFLYEVYDNDAAAQAHRQTDHFKKYAATTANMVVGRNVRPMKPIAFNSKGR